jgi:hypothetical protein
MRRDREMVGVLAWAGLAISVMACGGGSGATVAPPASPQATSAPAASGGDSTGAIDCSLLTPSDFAAAGVDGAADPTDNPDGSSHYCVYAGASGATGGIELDVFPHDDVASAEETYRTALSEGPAGEPATGATFSESSFAIVDDVAYLTVRQGKLVIALSVTNDINTEVGLVQLANLVVQRAGAAAGAYGEPGDLREDPDANEDA